MLSEYFKERLPKFPVNPKGIPHPRSIGFHHHNVSFRTIWDLGFTTIGCPWFLTGLSLCVWLRSLTLEITHAEQATQLGERQ